jgi:hypothetical protein
MQRITVCIIALEVQTQSAAPQSDEVLSTG